MLPEREVDRIIRFYNNPICEVIDNYNCSAYYEPSYVIARLTKTEAFKTTLKRLKSKNIIKQKNPHLTQMRIFVKYYLVVNL